MSKKKTWWCSWTFPLKHRASKEIAAKWPDGMRGWRTGESDAHEIWCGRVEAASRSAAIDVVGSMYGKLAPQLRWRFGPDEKPAGWWPEPSRFPRGRDA